MFQNIFFIFIFFLMSLPIVYIINKFKISWLKACLLGIECTLVGISNSFQSDILIIIGIILVISALFSYKT
ncbi:hypothetical protein CF046_18490 [Clostridium botulinum]|nr:hypothetical protein CGQ41_18840 [Clostridium botulinum]